MLKDDQLERYARHIILKQVGGSGQKKLLNSRVLVIGAGGLGSPLLMYLVAAGVGMIGIVDDDTVALSNLQRQIIHTTDRIDQPKTHSAKTALSALNPDCNIVCHATRLTADNAETIIADYDIVADGCDNFTTRLLVNDACVQLGKTLVSGAISQFDGQISTFKPHASTEKGPRLPCYRCFVPDIPSDEGSHNCQTEGVLGVMAGVVGTLLATEVIKELLDLGNGLAGHILFYDALAAETRKIRLPTDPQCPTCRGLHNSV